MTATDWGALGFGLIIGWYIYYVNRYRYRYRKGEVQFSDITTLVGAIGGASVLTLFDKGTELFGFYGIGLAAGFFGYFICLLLFVGNSGSFNFDWFLDGRRKDPPAGWSIPGDTRPTVAPMYLQPNPAAVAGPVEFFGTNPAQQGMHVAAAPAPAMLPQPMAAPDPTAQSIIRACKDEWAANKYDCNRFVKAVGSHFGVTLTGNADAIVAQIQGPHWTRITGGKAAAREDQFVIGGMTSGALGSAHGHVVVVVDGASEHGLYPAAWWGSLNPAIRDMGGLGKGVIWSFSKADRNHVVYAVRRV